MDAQFSTSGPPQSLLVGLRSIVEPLDLAEIFPSRRPLEVELGCGDGSFLVRHAALHPEINFIGVERLLGRIRKLDRKGRRAGLANLRGMRIESAYFLEWLLPPHSAAALHIYFPDPWPKKKHRRFRLINDRFPQIAKQALAAGGAVHLRTDDADYFEQMKSVFGASADFAAVETPPALSALTTDFEEVFQRRGLRTLRASYRKKI